MTFEQSASAGAQPVVRFHRQEATEASDTLDTWEELRTVGPNAVTLASWDYKTLVATGVEASGAVNNGDWRRLDIHDASLPYRFADSAATQRHSDLRLAAYEAGYRRFEGEGSVSNENSTRTAKPV